MKRRYKILITSLIVLIAIACYGVNWGINNVLPYSAIKPFRLTSPLIIEKFKEKYTPNRFNLTLKPFSFTTNDNITLRGWFIPTQYKAKGTILVLHGIASSKQLMLPYAYDLVKDSFNVVVYDSRAHGESGGEYCTLGFYEKYDVSKCIDRIINQFGNSCAPFGILGNSMGAAVALQAMPLDKRIVCGISESSFANLRETLSDYLERMIHVRWDWISSPAFARSEEIAHFRIDDVSPENSARSITQPVMIIHGGADEKINIKYAHRIYNRLQSPKQLYIVKGAGHENLPQKGGEEYHKKVIVFFSKWMVKNYQQKAL